MSIPAAPNRGTPRSRAAALGTTVPELTSGTADLPPGREQAAGASEFAELDADECRALLGDARVGRIAVPSAEEPVVVPVNYVVVGAAFVRIEPDLVTGRELVGGRSFYGRLDLGV